MLYNKRIEFPVRVSFRGGPHGYLLNGKLKGTKKKKKNWIYNFYKRVAIIIPRHPLYPRDFTGTAVKLCGSPGDFFRFHRRANTIERVDDVSFGYWDVHVYRRPRRLWYIFFVYFFAIIPRWFAVAVYWTYKDTWRDVLQTWTSILLLLFVPPSRGHRLSKTITICCVYTNYELRWPSLTYEQIVVRFWQVLSTLVPTKNQVISKTLALWMC